jgi:hypothetical protein
MTIKEIEDFISENKTKIPKVVHLNNHTTITDSLLFMESHLGYMKTYQNHQSVIEPYKKRLITFIDYIKKANSN